MVAYPRLRIDIELFIFHSPIIYPFWRTLEIDCPLTLFLLLGQNRWGWILAVGGEFAFLTARIAQIELPSDHRN